MKRLFIMLMLGGVSLLGQPKHHHGGHHHPPHDKPPCHAPIDTPTHKYMLMIFGVGLILYSSKIRQ